MTAPAGPRTLWADLDAESRKPGPTMTITKAQYAALAEATALDVERLARALAEARVARPQGWASDRLLAVFVAAAYQQEPQP